jgi:hypothetical protein
VDKRSITVNVISVLLIRKQSRQFIEMQESPYFLSLKAQDRALRKKNIKENIKYE